MRFVLDFLGTHWREVAIAALLFAISFFWWKDHNSLVKALDASVESYETRIKGLKESHKRETKRKESALKEYQEKLVYIETEYQIFQQEVAEAKIQRTDEFINLRRDNPDKLAEEIEDKFGFEYVK